MEWGTSGRRPESRFTDLGLSAQHSVVTQSHAHQPLICHLTLEPRLQGWGNATLETRPLHQPLRRSTPAFLSLSQPLLPSTPLKTECALLQPSIPLSGLRLRLIQLVLVLTQKASMRTPSLTMRRRTALGGDTLFLEYVPFLAIMFRS